jgi:hypothetical protein
MAVWLYKVLAGSMLLPLSVKFPLFMIADMLGASFSEIASGLRESIDIIRTLLNCAVLAKPKAETARTSAIIATIKRFMLELLKSESPARRAPLHKRVASGGSRGSRF